MMKPPSLTMVYIIGVARGGLPPPPNSNATNGKNVTKTLVSVSFSIFQVHSTRVKTVTNNNFGNQGDPGPSIEFLPTNLNVRRERN